MPEDLLEVHQALYGYDEGHRLISASTHLEGDAQRMLRSLTDIAFDGKAKSYLTIAPIPPLGVQVFIKTWPAESWKRPGSVWSHVLLVGFPDLGRLQGMQGLADAFRRPKPEGHTLASREIQRYANPLAVRRDLGVRLPRSTAWRPVLNGVYSGLYERDAPVRIRVPDASEYESVLLAIFEQQWPRLRRNFAGRTRQRSSTLQMDLEIVERTGTRDSTDALVDSDVSWAQTPLADLFNPNPAFRNFLQLCGAESPAGRGVFRPLADIFSAASAPQPSHEDVLGLVRDNFPAWEEQRAVKRVLFGPAREFSRDAERFLSLGSGWPREEQTRVLLAVRAASWVDLADIQLGQRLVRLYQLEPNVPSPLLRLDIESLSMRSVEALVTGVIKDADAATVIGVAVSQPDLGLLLAAKDVGLLASSQIWGALDNDLLLDLLTDARSIDRRDFVLDQLLEEGAYEPVARVCGAFPDEWWNMLIRSARRHEGSLVDRARTLRASLERLGTAALNSPPINLRSPDELLTLLLAADLTSGLWRRASVGDWISVAVAADGRDPFGLPRYARERLMTVALVGAAQSGSDAMRSRGWMTCFPFLHSALESKSFDREAWSLLSSALPSGPDWDRCFRLRRGVAFEIRKDRWDPADIRVVLDAAAPYTDDLLSVVRERKKSKKDNWFKQVMRLFT